MFYDYIAKILSESFASLCNIKCDLQPCDKVFTFEGNLQFEAKYKLFAERNTLITKSGYMRIENVIYKIMDIKFWNDYMEVWLYECKRNI